MKKIFVLTAALSLGACATAGTAKDPCGLVKNEKDPFVGEQRGFMLYLDQGQFTALSVMESKGAYKLTLMLAQNGNVRDVAPVGQKGEFALGDRVITLETVKESKPVASANTYVGILTQWQFEFGLTKELAEQLAHQPVKAVKVAFGGQTLQMKVEERPAEKVQNSVTCLVK